MSQVDKDEIRKGSKFGTLAFLSSRSLLLLSYIQLNVRSSYGQVADEDEDNHGCRILLEK